MIHGKQTARVKDPAQVLIPTQAAVVTHNERVGRSLALTLSLRSCLSPSSPSLLVALLAQVHQAQNSEDRTRDCNSGLLLSLYTIDCDTGGNLTNHLQSYDCRPGRVRRSVRDVRHAIPKANGRTRPGFAWAIGELDKSLGKEHRKPRTAPPLVKFAGGMTRLKTNNGGQQERMQGENF